MNMTKSTEKTFRQGEVWIARVRFIQDPTKSKPRSVVIVGNELALDVDVIVNPITREAQRNDFDVEIKHWQTAGLRGPSIVRTSKPLTIIGTELHEKIGELHEEDLTYVLEKAKEIF